ncbi:MAG: ATP phosphoribosyltransferase regulatory subunit [Acetobacteraceae bacterium]
MRLSYAGSCVLVGTPGRDGVRQITQVGLELIGPDSAQADAGVILVTSSALSALQVANVLIDLSCPNIARALIATETFTAAQEVTLIQALDRKDVAAVRDLGGALAPVLTQLLRATGPARHALEILTQLDLPPSAADAVKRLQEVVNAVWAADPAIILTIDPAEFRSWQYHTGLCMTVFAADVREEIGRGGRYLSYEQEAACGMTLRPEALLKAPRAACFPEKAGLPAARHVRRNVP